MSGGFYILEYMPELEEFYKINKEIVCYSDMDDLIQKIKYFLINDKERETIRLAGYQRALQEHSWQKRLSSVFKEIGIQ